MTVETTMSEGLTLPETDNSADSSSEQTTEKTQTTGGENTQSEEDKLPFHKHPRWTKREEEWRGRFNEMETRHQDELKKIREEFGKKTQSSDIPSWFGGDEAGWQAFQEYNGKVLTQVEERALKRIEDKKAQDDKAVKEASDYMEAEISAIESDKELNSKGEKVDGNKLLKFVFDNHLVDEKGRWNYRLGYRFMSNQLKPVTRKGLAGATTSESGAETQPTAFKTPADFKRGKPW